MSQVQTHELVAGLEASHENGHVSLCTRVGLHVNVLGIEDLFQALDSDVLALVNALAAAIVTVARIALGILVGQATAHGLHHLVAHEVLTGDEFNAVLLTLMFTLDDVKNHFVSFHFRV